MNVACQTSIHVSSSHSAVESTRPLFVANAGSLECCVSVAILATQIPLKFDLAQRSDAS